MLLPTHIGAEHFAQLLAVAEDPEGKRFEVPVPATTLRPYGAVAAVVHQPTNGPQILQSTDPLTSPTDMHSAAAAAVTAANGISSVSFQASCHLCRDSVTYLAVSYAPLLGPGRVGRSGPYISSELTSLQVGGPPVPVITAMKRTASFYFHAFCHSRNSSQIIILAPKAPSQVSPTILPMDYGGGRNKTCLLKTNSIKGSFPRGQFNSNFNLTCSGPISSRTAVSTSPSIPAHFTLSLNSSCSRCSNVKAIVRFKPITLNSNSGSDDGGWALAGWFDIKSITYRLVSTQHSFVYLYAHCASHSSGGSKPQQRYAMEWAGNFPAAVIQDKRCRNDVNMTKIDLSRHSSNGIAVAQLTCASDSSSGQIECECAPPSR